MQAIQNKNGELILQQLPRPIPNGGEVLIQVEAAGVNRSDVLQRKGYYLPPEGASPLLGLEVAGTIIAVGPGVDSGALKQKVTALTPGGGYAEYCVTAYSQCLPIPKGLTIAEAASLPETFFTVWSNLFERCHFAPGETLLIQGGTSGIGVTAIQIAHALGHPVYATAGSHEKCAACLKLGASRAINYKTEDFAQVVKEATEGRGVDVILDIIGGDYIAREVPILAKDGRLALIGMMGGRMASFNGSELIHNRLTITGSSLRPASLAYKAHIAQKLKTHIWPLIEEGKIRPVLYKTFPFTQAAEAHRLMESSEHIGKIVLLFT